MNYELIAYTAILFIGILAVVFIWITIKTDTINHKLEAQEFQRKLAEMETEEWREKLLEKVKEKIG